MRLRYCTLISAGLLLLAIPCFAIAGPKSASSRKHSHANVKHTAVKHKKTSRFAAHFATHHHEATAVEMPAERATQIQAALIKQGYLTGEPSGTWDAQTVSAMQKLQEDNGWQSKITPDSRALIKLGLGPQTPASDSDSDQAHDIVQAQQQ